MKSFSEATIGNIDQLIFRFTKLQDELGNNTFRFLLEYLQEDISDKPFRDILNVLQRLKIIESSDAWLSLRELRNDLTHDYPELSDETTAKLPISAITTTRKHPFKNRASLKKGRITKNPDSGMQICFFAILCYLFAVSLIGR